MSKLALVLILFISFPSFSKQENWVANGPPLKKDQVESLNQLRDEINDYYGLHEGAPRINSGPCGRFANLFFQKWNELFTEKVSISFIMSADSSECYHVLVKLPNNSYYDGGSGIMKRRVLLKGYQKGTYIIDMIEYDFDLLDEMSYGLERDYKLCTNYSDVKTSEIIKRNLMQITSGRL